MTGSVVEQLVPTPLEMNSSSPEASDVEAQRIGVASAVALLSGITMVGWMQKVTELIHFSTEQVGFHICLHETSFPDSHSVILLPQLCMFGLQLGFLSTYLSEPIVKAFTSAAAFHVTISQLQSMLGLRLPRHTGNFSLFKVIRALCLGSLSRYATMKAKSHLTDLCAQTLASVMENLPHTNTAELLISLVCLAVLVPVKEVNTRYRHRLRTPIPVEIFTVSHPNS